MDSKSAFDDSSGMVIVIRIDWNKNTYSIYCLVVFLELMAEWLFLCLVDCGMKWN